MKFTPKAIADVLVIKPRVFGGVHDIDREWVNAVCICCSYLRNLSRILVWTKSETVHVTQA